MDGHYLNEQLLDMFPNDTLRVLVGVAPGTVRLTGLQEAETQACWRKAVALVEALHHPADMTIQPSVFWVPLEVDEDNNPTRQAGVLLLTIHSSMA